jgi:flagellar P-ring protein FlgI
MRRIAVTLRLLTLAAAFGGFSTFADSVAGEPATPAAVTPALVAAAPQAPAKTAVAERTAVRTEVGTTPVRNLVVTQGLNPIEVQGVGIVVGLSGTGDKSVPARQMLAAYLQTIGHNFQPADLPAGNMAMVSISAELPEIPLPGKKINVSVHSINDAKSLAGGHLLQSPLKGVSADPKSSQTIYAWAKGALETAQGQVNATTAVITAGGNVSVEVERNFIENDAFTLQIKNDDPELATAVAENVNQWMSFKRGMSLDIARVTGPNTIRIEIPSGEDRKKPSDFYAEVMSLSVPYEPPATIVINPKTGAIVISKGVSVAPTTIIYKGTPVVIKPMESLNESEQKAEEASRTIMEKNENGEQVPKDAHAVMRLGGTNVTLGRLVKDLSQTFPPQDVAEIIKMLANPQVGAIRARVIFE